MRKLAHHLATIFCLLAFLVFGPQAVAAPLNCLPKDWGGGGSPLHYDSNDGWGMWVAWACPVKAADGTWTYALNHLVALYSVRPGGTTSAALLAAAKTLTDVGAANALLTSASVAPAAGAETTNFNRLAGLADAYAKAHLVALMPIPSP